MRKKSTRLRVRGYWVFTNIGGREGRYVKGYLRKRPLRKLIIRIRPNRPEKSIPIPPKGYRLVRHIDYLAEHPDAVEDFAERRTYTFKMCCLVELNYAYPVSFQRFEESPEKHYRTIQYYHTKFMSTIQEATTDLFEKVKLMRAFGDIAFVAVDLYAVSGQGMLRERRWDLIASYVTPEEVSQ